jgi:hypothetical protein
MGAPILITLEDWAQREVAEKSNKVTTSIKAIQQFFFMAISFLWKIKIFGVSYFIHMG